MSRESEALIKELAHRDVDIVELKAKLEAAEQTIEEYGGLLDRTLRAEATIKAIGDYCDKIKGLGVIDAEWHIQALLDKS